MCYIKPSRLPSQTDALEQVTSVDDTSYCIWFHVFICVLFDHHLSVLSFSMKRNPTLFSLLRYSHWLLPLCPPSPPEVWTVPLWGPILNPWLLDYQSHSIWKLCIQVFASTVKLRYLRKKHCVLSLDFQCRVECLIPIRQLRNVWGIDGSVQITNVQ